MPESVTLEQVETLVVQLPTKDQLRLLAHISEGLSSSLLVMPGVESPNEQSVGDERLQLATTLCEEVEILSMIHEGNSTRRMTSIACARSG